MELANKLVGTRELELSIAEIVISELRLENVTPETFEPEMDLVDELGIDSMDLPTIVLVLQDKFGITIEQDDYPKLRNLRKISVHLQGLIAR